MITTTILVVLGIALVFVVWQMMRNPKKPRGEVTPMPPVAAIGASVDLWNAQPGDVVSIHGAAEDFSDLDFTVNQRNAYQAAGRRWIGLAGDFRGRPVFLEVNRAATMEVMGILDPTQFTLPDVGLTEERLADFDSRQDSSAFVEFLGKRWQFKSSRELAYFENEGEARGLYRWLFSEKGGARMLCVEKCEGEPFQIQLAQNLNAQDITVYRAR
ncbi:MAG: hypothetical protein HY820_23880 [Acidobacteria bacterium]|nr:hypothetical protein [Acidobacteriota bacterium]